MTLIERAKHYVETLPASVAGSRGHDALFRAACVLSHGFNLDDADAWPILLDYNARCLPPWSEGELRHKLTQAHTAAHSKGRGHFAGVPAPERRPDPIDPPPRIHGRITLDGIKPLSAKPLTVSKVADNKPDRATVVETVNNVSTAPADAEAQRISGELVKLHQQGIIKGADDPEAAFLARLIHGVNGRVAGPDVIP